MILQKAIGTILVEMGSLASDELTHALERQRQLMQDRALPEGIARVHLISEARRSKAQGQVPLIGEILLDLRLVEADEIDRALKVQAESLGIYRGLETNKLGVAIEIGSIVNSSLNISEVLCHIMNHVNFVTASVASTLMLLDEKTGELVFSVPTGPKAGRLTDIRLSPGEGIAGWVAQNRKPALVPDTRSDPRFFSGIDHASGLETESILCVPLMAKNRLIGVLEVINKIDGSTFTENDLLMLSVFAHQAALAIENARLHSDLKTRLEEQKRIDKALRRSETRYRLLVDTMAEGLGVQDENGRVSYVNDHLCRMLGYEREEIIDRPVADFIHKADMPEFRRQMTRRQQGEEERYEITLSGKAGRKVFALMSPRALFNDAGRFKGSFAAIVDLSERKKMEAALHEAQRMKAIGTLAGGIAHQFNNALTGIAGNIELLKMSLPNDEAVSRYTPPMESQLNRMAGLTEHLLAYAREGRYQPRIICLNDFLRQTLPLIQHKTCPEVEIESDFSAPSQYVDVDPTQMQMVLSAIVNNAAEALGGNGRIRLTLERVTLEKDPSADPFAPEPGDYACLSIEDNGKGMDPETRKRIFEPFFTTNFHGRGLGLAAAYGIVRNHNGWISVASETQKGSMVKIYLPRAIPTHKKDIEPRQQVAPPPGTLLIVEDEEVVMDVTRAMAKKLGYRVLVAEDGAKALHLARTFDGTIDLALLDIVLPDMDGKAVFIALAKARPEMKVIVCSGYSMDGPVEEIIQAGAVGFIQKPFSFQVLTENLEKAMENR
ncbi:MAG: PAS domain S-box protein [Desulfobacterales bacterium]|nr:PAS domain S-box protein [Desulfobacterales bacterium]